MLERAGDSRNSKQTESNYSRPFSPSMSHRLILRPCHLLCNRTITFFKLIVQAVRPPRLRHAALEAARRSDAAVQDIDSTFQFRYREMHIAVDNFGCMHICKPVMQYFFPFRQNRASSFGQFAVGFQLQSDGGDGEFAEKLRWGCERGRRSTARSPASFRQGGRRCARVPLSTPIPFCRRSPQPVRTGSRARRPARSDPG